MKLFKSKIVMWYDGACEPVNPGGYGGAGVVIEIDGKRVFEFSRNLGNGKMSNNIAEYAGLIEGLSWLLEQKLNHQPIQVYGDNLMTVNQMAGRWRAKKGLYLPWFQTAKTLRNQFKNLRFDWIPREQNGKADEMSKKALRDAGIKFRIQPEDHLTKEFKNVTS